MSWDEDDFAWCKNCGQECKPEKYKRLKEDYDPPGSNAFVTDWRSPCCNDELSPEPVSDRCIWCGKCADLLKDENYNWCGNCGDLFCPECLGTWRGMQVCPGCKKDLIKDKGPDMEEVMAEAEYREER